MRGRTRGLDLTPEFFVTGRCHNKSRISFALVGSHNPQVFIYALSV
jgi:hypothetical protein